MTGIRAKWDRLTRVTDQSTDKPESDMRGNTPNPNTDQASCRTEDLESFVRTPHMRDTLKIRADLGLSDLEEPVSQKVRAMLEVAAGFSLSELEEPVSQPVLMIDRASSSHEGRDDTDATWSEPAEDYAENLEPDQYALRHRENVENDYGFNRQYRFEDTDYLMEQDLDENIYEEVEDLEEMRVLLPLEASSLDRRVLLPPEASALDRRVSFPPEASALDLTVQAQVLEALSLNDGAGVQNLRELDENRVSAWLNVFAGKKENSKLGSILLQSMYDEAVNNHGNLHMAGGEISGFVSAVDDLKSEIIDLANPTNSFDDQKSVSDLVAVLTSFREKVSMILTDEDNFSASPIDDDTSYDGDDSFYDNEDIKLSFNFYAEFKDIEDSLKNAITKLEQLEDPDVRQEEVLAALSLSYADKGLVALDKEKVTVWLNEFLSKSENGRIATKLLKELYSTADENDGDFPMIGGEGPDFVSLLDNLGSRIAYLVRNPTVFLDREDSISGLLYLLVALKKKLNMITDNADFFYDHFGDEDTISLHPAAQLGLEDLDARLHEAITELSKL